MHPTPAEIISIKEEAKNVLSFTFAYEDLNSTPGQFVMIWIPGVDQKPFSIAGDDGKTFTTAVFKVENFTSALFDLQVGDKVGVTGPFGNPYSWQEGQHIIAVGGGYGSAPLAYLLDNASADTTGNKCTGELLIGARNEDLLLYADYYKADSGITTHISTDDGSRGHKGYITEVLDQRLNALSDAEKANTIVCVCGPEMMEKAAAEVAAKHGVASQISVERYMKCGFGVCGQCVVDDTGETMCQTGPVVSGEHALGLKEFGKYHRNKAGQKVNY